MKLEPQNDRIINGLLKADIALSTPEQIQTRLAQDILIVADPQRSEITDLWPAIWFLASIIEREFTGKVFIKAGLDRELPSPIPLGPRCVFVPEEFSFDGDTIGIGGPIEEDSMIWGDARGNRPNAWALSLYRWSVDDIRPRHVSSADYPGNADRRSPCLVHSTCATTHTFWHRANRQMKGHYELNEHIRLSPSDAQTLNRPAATSHGLRLHRRFANRR